MDAYCSRCRKEIELEEKVQRFSNNTLHIRGNCPECKMYVKYIPYIESGIVRKLIRDKYESEEKFESEQERPFMSEKGA